MRRRKYRPGDYLFYCDRCAKVTYASEGKVEELTRLFVCETCYDPRHPQDLLKGKADKQNVELSRPEPKDEFI